MSRAVLIVEDDRRTAAELCSFLEADYECLQAHDDRQALGLAREHEIVAALVDLHLGPKTDGFDVIRELRRLDPRTAILVVTGDETEDAVKRARDLEVDDFIPKSIGAGELQRAVRRSLVLRRVAQRLSRYEPARPDETSLLVADSAAMKPVLEGVERAARHRGMVLITGPVGAGKMIVAHQIHALSTPARPFERAHCAQFDTGELALSQLFGHEPGAHSTATSRYAGAFERAEDGTLLLDDIDHLPVPVQAKLLQPLAERTFRRLMGREELPVRCRVLVTTNKDLDALARGGKFLPDLLSRLRGGQCIVVPGIAGRADDLPGLVRILVQRLAAEAGGRMPVVPADFLDAVRKRAWSDARELHTAVRYAWEMSAGGSLEPSLLPPAAGVSHDPRLAGAGGADVERLLDGTMEDVLNRVRGELVRRALGAADGDKKAAAARLDIAVQWLNEILRREKEAGKE